MHADAFTTTIPPFGISGCAITPNWNYTNKETTPLSIYQKRASLIASFVDRYGLSVSSDYQSDLDEILAIADLGTKPESTDVSSISMGGITFDLPNVWKVKQASDDYAQYWVSPYCGNASLNLSYTKFGETQSQEDIDASLKSFLSAFADTLVTSGAELKSDLKNNLKEVNGFTTQDETLSFLYGKRECTARAIVCSDGNGILAFLLTTPTSRYDDYAISMNLAIESVRKDGDEPSREYKDDQKAASDKVEPPSSSNLVSPQSNALDEETQGRLVATFQEEVSSKLKSPRSAKYPWSFKEYTFTSTPGSTHPGYARYQIDSYVDADNSYGANIRIYCRVVVDMKKSDGSYYLISCSKLER